MPLSLERVRGRSYILRAGPEHFGFGDPYAAAGTVEIDIHNPEHAEVKGFVSTTGVPLADWVDFRRRMKPMGVRTLTIERRRADKSKREIWKL